MTFDPAKINLQQLQYQCEHGGRRSVCVKAKVCFDFTVKSDKMDSTFAAGGPKKKKDQFDIVVVVI